MPWWFGLIAAISGLILSWRSYRLAKKETQLKETQVGNQHRSSLIDDLEQVLQALREEYNRLKEKYEKLNNEHQTLRTDYDRQQSELDQLRKEVIVERLKRVALEERLDIERQLFSERFEALEADMKRLQHLKTNT